METIGLFQLENLILSRSPFLFLDVRSGEGPRPPEPIAGYLKAAVQIDPNQALEHVRGKEKERPILLIANDESAAAKVALTLEAAGFTNVYIIAGGLPGLMSEL